MKAIVTGGAGFIGSHIVDRLIDMGLDVIVLDNLSTGKGENINPRAVFVHTDIVTDLWCVRNLFEGCSYIFHNAASKKNVCLNDPIRDAQTNAVATLRLLQLAEEYNVGKFIHASTGSVYGEASGVITESTPTFPVSYYGVSKLAGENYVSVFDETHEIKTTILRYFHVIGERQNDDPLEGGVVAIFKKKIADGVPILIHGDGTQTRLFTHVSSVVDANIAAMGDVSNGMIYNCATEERTTISELAYLLGAKDILYGDPLPGDIYDFRIDNTMIRRELGVEFCPLKEGLKK